MFIVLVHLKAFYRLVSKGVRFREVTVYGVKEAASRWTVQGKTCTYWVSQKTIKQQQQNIAFYMPREIKLHEGEHNLRNMKFIEEKFDFNNRIINK